MIKTNRSRLPVIPVQAEVTPLCEPGYLGLQLNEDGTGIAMPAAGGICKNFRVGDRCSEVLGVHIAPGVNIKGAGGSDGALNCYAGTGTRIKLMGSDGAGYVLGSCSPFTGGIFTAAFPKETMQSMNGDERFILDCSCCGLQMTDWPDIMCHIDPELLERLPIKEENGSLLVPVAHILPERTCGGLGGDVLSVMMTDPTDRTELGLDELRFGDFVMFTDIDSTFGGAFLEGAVTIGVVTDSGAPHVGGGPTVSVLFSCKTDRLGGYISDEGNLGCYFREVQ